MAEIKILFLDTNIYLPYQRFDQVNWLDVVQAEALRIIVPPVTTRELNKIKDTHSQPQIRKRAGDITQRLWGLFSTSDVAILRERVEIHLHPDDPLIDFASHNLSRDVQDDQLIASIIAYRQDNHGAEILLVTTDAGVLLMGKARRQGLQAIPCPDNLKLPVQPDPEQVQIRELQTELAKLKNRLPKLDLQFMSGDKRVEFKLTPIAEITSDEIQQALDEVKRKYPKREVSPSRPRSDKTGGVHISDLLAAAAQNPLGTIPREQIVKYNEALNKYFEQYEKYLREQRAFEIILARSVRIEIQLVNNGTAPAEDVDISMHFPDGFTLLSEDNVPEPPTRPEPPSPPQSTMELMMQGIAHPVTDYYPYLGHNTPHFEGPSNVSAPYIKRTNSYDVGVHVDKIKHLLPEPLDPLFIVFDSFERVSSFHLDYEIHTASLPEKISSTLHVLIRK